MGLRKMGIHRKPMDQGHSGLLDSRLHGNDGGLFFRRGLRVASTGKVVSNKP